jgi:hypothetical protein
LGQVGTPDEVYQRYEGPAFDIRYEGTKCVEMVDRWLARRPSKYARAYRRRIILRKRISHIAIQQAEAEHAQLNGIRVGRGRRYDAHGSVDTPVHGMPRLPSEGKPDIPR